MRPIMLPPLNAVINFAPFQSVCRYRRGISLEIPAPELASEILAAGSALKSEERHLCGRFPQQGGEIARCGFLHTQHPSGEYCTGNTDGKYCTGNTVTSIAQEIQWFSLQCWRRASGNRRENLRPLGISPTITLLSPSTQMQNYSPFCELATYN